jgi:putative multiple sugar transport system substrate-binding protein
VLAKAKESNILIINYDLMALNTPDIDYYIGFDNKQVGTIQANYIVEKLDLANGAGPFNMEIFAGSLDEVNAYWYYEEAMKVLQPYIDKGQLVVKSGQTALETVTIPAWAAETTSARMENLVTTYYSDGTPLDVVLAPADSIGVPIGNTLKSIGYGTADMPMPIITGNNGNTSAIQSIISGQMSMSIFKDTRNLARRTAEVIDSIANGVELVPYDTETFDNGVIKIPAFLYGMEVIDSSNWKALALDSGYYTAEQLGVK